MKKPYVDGNTLYLEKEYAGGVDRLTFGEITAREMGEVPIGDALKFKEYYPLVCMLTGVTPGFLAKLSKNDIVKAVEHTAFLFAS